MEFNDRRRQPFLDEVSFNNTMAAFDDDFQIIARDLAAGTEDAAGRAELLKIKAQRLWSTFQLHYTAGKDVAALSSLLAEVVEAFENAVAALCDVPGDDCYPVLTLDDMIDNYVDFLNLLSAAVLLHREDLIPAIFTLIEGTDYEGADAVIESVLAFYLPGRPAPDALLWKNHEPLLAVISCETAEGRRDAMEPYVRNWYKSMKGVAHFWGKHEQIKAEYSPYDGYWAMCAAAFTYLYDIDDSTFRGELVFPEDMLDYARSLARKPVRQEDGGESR